MDKWQNKTKGRQKQNKPKYDSESVGLVGRRLTMAYICGQK